MPTSLPRRARRTLLVAALFALGTGCTAVSLSPPLSPSPTPQTDPGRQYVLLSSGSFDRPHQSIGVLQMTQTGYRWFHEVEVVADANPASILYKIAAYARENGADGVAHLELIDLNPQNPGEKLAKQVEQRHSHRRRHPRRPTGRHRRRGHRDPLGSPRRARRLQPLIAARPLPRFTSPSPGAIPMPRLRFVSLLLFVVSSLAVTGCTARSSYVMSPQLQSRYLITMGDTERPHESLGYLQLTRKGADLFGFIPIVDADLEKMFGDELIAELARRGADGIVNVQFHERQWTTAERIIFALPPMFLIPLPTRVEIRGELIRFTAPGGPGAGA